VKGAGTLIRPLAFRGEENGMMWTICMVLIVLWLLGMVTLLIRSMIDELMEEIDSL
jgi:amino acid permease